MSRKRSTPFIAALLANPAVQFGARTLYYLAILIGLIVMYGKGDFSTPSFVYQGF